MREIMNVTDAEIRDHLRKTLGGDGSRQDRTLQREVLTRSEPEWLGNRWRLQREAHPTHGSDDKQC